VSFWRDPRWSILRFVNFTGECYFYLSHQSSKTLRPFSACDYRSRRRLHETALGRGGLERALRPRTDLGRTPTLPASHCPHGVVGQCEAALQGWLAAMYSAAGHNERASPNPDQGGRALGKREGRGRRPVSDCCQSREPMPRTTLPVQELLAVRVTRRWVPHPSSMASSGAFFALLVGLGAKPAEAAYLRCNAR
jgi:hypothetical protein